MTLTQILKDTARASEHEIKREYRGSIYWVRKCGSGFIVTADGQPISAVTSYQRALVNLSAVTW